MIAAKSSKFPHHVNGFATPKRDYQEFNEFNDNTTDIIPPRNKLLANFYWFIERISTHSKVYQVVVSGIYSSGGRFFPAN
jgi:hypothetical protein